MSREMADTRVTEQGPNPWKTVIVFEELEIPYTTQYLDFGNGKNGVENSDFLKKNAAGRVPLIRDPDTGRYPCTKGPSPKMSVVKLKPISSHTGITLTESNAIDEYLVDRYDSSGRLAVQGSEAPYLVRKWLGFQASTQAPFYAQVSKY